MRIADWREVYVAWQNTDLTEGKGWVRPYKVCQTRATAVRLGAKQDVQGCDCKVTREIAVKIEGDNGTMYELGPCHIELPNNTDKERAKRDEAWQDVCDKARSHGLTQDEIDQLVAGP